VYLGTVVSILVFTRPIRWRKAVGNTLFALLGFGALVFPYLGYVHAETGMWSASGKTAFAGAWAYGVDKNMPVAYLIFQNLSPHPQAQADITGARLLVKLGAHRPCDVAG